MDITAPLLHEMFQGFNALFNKNMQATPSYWRKIAMDVKPTGADETYGWLAGAPQIREWIGARVIQGVKGARYTIENRAFESTICVERKHIEDDRLGVSSPQV